METIDEFVYKQKLEQQEFLLKYIEHSMIYMQKYLDDGKNLQDFYNKTKEIYWGLKEKMIEKVNKDLSAGYDS